MHAKPLQILILLLLTLAGCKKAPHAAAASSSPQTPPGVKSTPLKIELTTIPAGFKPVAGAVDPIRLTSADGEITIALGTSTDLAAAARNEEARLDGLPQGRSLGSIELLCQFGRALLTRGLYRDEGGTETEEIRISLLAARPLVLAYRYPATGSRRERLEQALALLRNLQPL